MLPARENFRSSELAPVMTLSLIPCVTFVFQPLSLIADRARFVEHSRACDYKEPLLIVCRYIGFI
jgi:hypothetical protein